MSAQLSARERLLSRLNKNGPIPAHHPELGPCWEWTGHRLHNGYGSLLVDGRQEKTHRFSFRIHKGPITEGLFILHECDNPACCNPDHLKPGTHARNMRDCVERGRHKSPNRKTPSGMTIEKAELIRRLYAIGEFSQDRIAEFFGITQTMVSLIATGKAWS